MQCYRLVGSLSQVVEFRLLLPRHDLALNADNVIISCKYSATPYSSSSVSQLLTKLSPVSRSVQYKVARIIRLVLKRTS